MTKDELKKELKFSGYPDDRIEAFLAGKPSNGNSTSLCDLLEVERDNLHSLREAVNAYSGSPEAKQYLEARLRECEHGLDACYVAAAQGNAAEIRAQELALLRGRISRLESAHLESIKQFPPKGTNENGS